MINIFGYGVTTKPLVRFLNSLGILVRIYDDKFSGTKDDECGNTRKILKNGEVAPPREDAVDLPELTCIDHPESHYVLRDGASGIFLAAHNFPAVREARPVKVAELKRFRDRISPKFYYLADGPETDPDGNQTEVHYSRKLKVQYLTSVTDEGKATSWAAFYQPETGTWKETTRTVKASQRSTSKSSSSKTSAAKTSAAKKSTAKSRTTKTTKAKK